MMFTEFARLVWDVMVRGTTGSFSTEIRLDSAVSTVTKDLQIGLEFTIVSTILFSRYIEWEAD